MHRSRKITTDMGRRRFLRGALASALCVGCGPGNWAQAKWAQAAAGSFPALPGRVLVNLFLAGGPDFRHLLPPAYSPKPGSYGRVFWRHRARAFGIGDTEAALQRHWNTHFTPASSGATRFGIMKSCGWLASQWRQGNVAIVCNTFGSDSRDHHHGILVMDLGDIHAGKLDQGSGWGGRLAYATDANAVALTNTPRPFAFGPDPAAPGDPRRNSQDRLIVAADTRNIALHTVHGGADWRSPDEYVTRALQSYYRGMAGQVDERSPYFRLFEHERKLREFGEAIDARLADIPVPPELQEITHWEGPVRADFGIQARNLYDALVCADLLNMRVASMSFEGWDSHDKQAESIEPMYADLFGHNGALARLYRALPDPVKRQMLFVIAGEFGRQLKDNGGNGTDHGFGNVVLLIGPSVRGGVYGDMFPESELARMDDPSPDIDGRTALDHVFGAASDWVGPGSGGFVFPDRASAPLEPGVEPRRFFG
ncbi:MAG: DUF1501 domain-containing protein [Thiohalocapsa sp.]|nr:DUF1501 domain-containing protein [Thiohalocapsa sp.]MCF7991817.1 DUF1501 domain-containing protein [Thiohalocapsa sp.]